MQPFKQWTHKISNLVEKFNPIMQSNIYYASKLLQNQAFHCTFRGVLSIAMLKLRGHLSLWHFESSSRILVHISDLKLFFFNKNDSKKSDKISFLVKLDAFVWNDNEQKMGLFHIPEYITYASALLLAGICFYSLKYYRRKIYHTKDTLND